MEAEGIHVNSTAQNETHVVSTDAYETTTIIQTREQSPKNVELFEEWYEETDIEETKKEKTDATSERYSEKDPDISIVPEQISCFVSEQCATAEFPNGSDSNLQLISNNSFVQLQKVQGFLSGTDETTESPNSCEDVSSSVCERSQNASIELQKDELVVVCGNKELNPKGKLSSDRQVHDVPGFDIFEGGQMKKISDMYQETKKKIKSKKRIGSKDRMSSKKKRLTQETDIEETKKEKTDATSERYSEKDSDISLVPEQIGCFVSEQCAAAEFPNGSDSNLQLISNNISVQLEKIQVFLSETDETTESPNSCEDVSSSVCERSQNAFTRQPCQADVNNFSQLQKSPISMNYKTFGTPVSPNHCEVSRMSGLGGILGTPMVMLKDGILQVEGCEDSELKEQSETSVKISSKNFKETLQTERQQFELYGELQYVKVAHSSELENDRKCVSSQEEGGSKKVPGRDILENEDWNTIIAEMPVSEHKLQNATGVSTGEYSVPKEMEINRVCMKSVDRTNDNKEIEYNDSGFELCEASLIIEKGEKIEYPENIAQRNHINIENSFMQFPTAQVSAECESCDTAKLPSHCNLEHRRALCMDMKFNKDVILAEQYDSTQLRHEGEPFGNGNSTSKCASQVSECSAHRNDEIENMKSCEETEKRKKVRKYKLKKKHLSKDRNLADGASVFSSPKTECIELLCGMIEKDVKRHRQYEVKQLGDLENEPQFGQNKTSEKYEDLVESAKFQDTENSKTTGDSDNTMGNTKLYHQEDDERQQMGYESKLQQFMELEVSCELKNGIANENVEINNIKLSNANEGCNTIIPGNFLTLPRDLNGTETTLAKEEHLLPEKDIRLAGVRNEEIYQCNDLKSPSDNPHGSVVKHKENLVLQQKELLEHLKNLVLRVQSCVKNSSSQLSEVTLKAESHHTAVASSQLGGRNLEIPECGKMMNTQVGLPDSDCEIIWESTMMDDHQQVQDFHAHEDCQMEYTCDRKVKWRKSTKLKKTVSEKKGSHTENEWVDSLSNTGDVDGKDFEGYKGIDSSKEELNNYVVLQQETLLNLEKQEDHKKNMKFNVDQVSEEAEVCQRSSGNESEQVKKQQIQSVISDATESLDIVQETGKKDLIGDISSCIDSKGFHGIFQLEKDCSGDDSLCTINGTKDESNFDVVSTSESNSCALKACDEIHSERNLTRACNATSEKIQNACNLMSHEQCGPQMGELQSDQLEFLTWEEKQLLDEWPEEEIDSRKQLTKNQGLGTEPKTGNLRCQMVDKSKFNSCTRNSAVSLPEEGEESNSGNDMGATKATRTIQLKHYCMEIENDQTNVIDSRFKELLQEAASVHPTSSQSIDLKDSSNKLNNSKFSSIYDKTYYNPYCYSRVPKQHQKLSTESVMNLQSQVANKEMCDSVHQIREESREKPKTKPQLDTDFKKSIHSIECQLSELKKSLDLVCKERGLSDSHLKCQKYKEKSGIVSKNKWMKTLDVDFMKEQDKKLEYESDSNKCSESCRKNSTESEVLMKRKFQKGSISVEKSRTMKHSEFTCHQNLKETTVHPLEYPEAQQKDDKLQLTQYLKC